MRLLVTRPRPDAARTAALLRARGHDPIVAPLIDIERLSQVDLSGGPWAAFLLTSANALLGLAEHAHRDDVRRVPVFTVGAQTAQAAWGQGFRNVMSADGGVADLANLVAARLTPPARLLYLAGEDRAGDLAGALSARGFAVDTVVVYRAVAAIKLPRAVVEALTIGIDGVLHYSRRSAEAYLAAARASGCVAGALKPAHFCLSAAVAAPLAQAGASSIRVAPEPTEAALLALIGAA